MLETAANKQFCIVLSWGAASVVPTKYSITPFCLSNNTSKDAEFHELSESITFFALTCFYN
jgi:hypothetical protein